MKESTQELIARIRENSELTNEEKYRVINALRGKKYGIVWEDRKEESWTNLMTDIPILEEVRGRAVISEEEGSPDHILIEGDNIDALVALTYTHEGKIDVIYIDPPYNTGNKDFVYNDSYVDSEDSFRHSKWLSFMRKRLKIAHRLLSDNGVIFISIDDNEQAQLKLLCDEIFGENNHITNIVWQSTAGSNTGSEIVTTTEYILVYTKRRSTAHFDGQTPSDDIYKYSDLHINERGRYTLDKLDRRRVGGHYSEALNFPIEMPDGTVRYPGGGQKPNKGWNYLWSESKIQWGIENDFIVFKKYNGIWAIYCKRYQKVDNTNKPVNRTTPYRNLITSDLFNTAQGTSEIADIFSYRPFAFPKPSAFVRFLLSSTVATLPDAIILDFFAGSGTTLHATMALNAEDGGHRQCILVTNNENRICEDVTYVRNRKVIEGYENQKGEKVKGLTANSLRYYRTKFVGREKTMKNGRELALAATDLVCIREGVYREKPQFGRLRLKPSVARCFEGKGKLILLIFNDAAIEPLADEMAAMDKSLKFKVYTLAPGDYAYDDEFEKVADRVELCPIPSSIYNAYDKVLPKKDGYADEQDDVEEEGADAGQEE